MTFTTNRPTPTEKLKISQPLINTNFTASNTSMSVDHYPFDDATANNGYHKTIHQTTFNTAVPGPGNQITRAGVGAVYANVPANISNIGQIFTALYTPDTSAPSAGDTQLFSRTGLGGISQLTGYNTGNPPNGWQWLGGILLQWGFVSSTTKPTDNGTVTFKTAGTGGIPFPNNCFNVVASLTNNGSIGTSNRDFVYIQKASGPTIPAKDHFNWIVNSTSGSVNGFFWIAIGN